MQHLLVICFILVAISFHSKFRLVNICFRNSVPHISINSDVSEEATKHVKNILCLVDRNSYLLTDECHLNNTKSIFYLMVHKFCLSYKGQHTNGF